MINLIFKIAHRIAKELKKEFSNIDYKAQVAINIKYLNCQIKKGDYKMLIDNMNLEELKELQTKVNAKIAEKEQQNKQEFTLEFEATTDPRKGKPYVAKLVIENGKIEREFFDLNRSYGKKEITVSGTYNVKVGEIIEQREGGSWKNDYRYWYLVKEDGILKKVADISDSRSKTEVEKYLKNEIKAEDLKEY